MSTRREAVSAWLRRPRALASLAALAFAGWLATGFYAVPATSVGVALAFGAVVDSAVPPGVHWWWPRPIGRVAQAEVTRTFFTPIGYRLIDDGRAADGGLSLSRWLTGDTNILEMRAKLNYRISDPVKYLFGSAQPEEVLRRVAGSAFTEAASGLPVDDLLTSGRLALSERVRARTQELLDAEGIGLQVLAVNLESVEPPSTVIAAFQGVQNARADRERMVSEAQSYANNVVPVARGEATKRVNGALAFADGRVSAAHGDAERFAKLAVEHRRAPGLLERRLYLETIDRVLPRVKRYVIDPADGAAPVRIVE